jgi:hypothetical protein
MLVFLGAFFLSLVLVLWCIAKYSRLFVLPLVVFYTGMGIDLRYIVLPDNNYSDVTHDFLGMWNFRVFILLVLAAFALQSYVIVKSQKHTLLASLRDAGEVGQKIPDPLVEWRADHLEFANNPFPQSTDRLALAA